MNSFFIDGNFRHFKWQYCLYRLDQLGKLKLIGVELRTYHPNGDLVGTLDGLVVIDDVPYIIDFKGMNVQAFMKFQREGATPTHRIQLVCYAVNNNIGRVVEPFSGQELKSLKVDKCILVGENKGGPTQNGSPTALHEDVFEVSRYRSEVKRKLNELRRSVDAEEIPKPACTSTRSIQFENCPFSKNCKEEVTRIQRGRETENRTAVDRERKVPGTIVTGRSRRNNSRRKGIAS